MVNTGDATAEADAQLPDDLRPQTRQIGVQLSTLVAALAATGQRVTAIGDALALATVEIPKLAGAARAGAQLELNNPQIDVGTKALAHQTLQRVDALTRELQDEMAGIRQRLAGMPTRGREMLTRAQLLLGGAPLSPLALDVPPLQLPTAAATPPPTPAAACPEPPPTRRNESSAVPWGWYVVAGAGAALTGAGVGVNLWANEQQTRCENASAFGCSNYDQIRREQDIGVIMWSAGAALTVSTLTFMIVTSAGGDPPEQQATYRCSLGYAGASCQGSF
jgi:hypothetical protein